VLECLSEAQTLFLLVCVCVYTQDVDSGDEDGPTARTEQVKDPDVLAFIEKLNLRPGRSTGPSTPCDPSRWSSCQHAFPDPGMAMSLDKGKWQRWGSYVYVCAWDLTHAAVLRQAFGRLPTQTPALPCPRCKSVERTTPDEWSKYPRRVVDINCCHYLYSRRYRCKGCPGEPPHTLSTNHVSLRG
jgi:hypothetical protein